MIILVGIKSDNLNHVFLWQNGILDGPLFLILYNFFVLSKDQKILSSYENQTILYYNYTSYILDAMIIHRMNWTCIKLIIVYGEKNHISYTPCRFLHKFHPKKIHWASILTTSNLVLNYSKLLSVQNTLQVKIRLS